MKNPKPTGPDYSTYTLRQLYDSLHVASLQLNSLHPSRRDDIKLTLKTCISIIDEIHKREKEHLKCQTHSKT